MSTQSMGLPNPIMSGNFNGPVLPYRGGQDYNFVHPNNPMSSIGLPTRLGRGNPQTLEQEKMMESALKKQAIAGYVKSLAKSFLPAGVSSLFDFGLSALGSVMQNKFQKDAEQRANSEWQNRFDLENAYNHPLAQAERFRQAGINPLSGLGLSTPAGSPAVPVSSGASAPTSSPLSSNAVDVAGTGLTQEQTATESFKQELIKAQKENEISQREGRQLENAFNSLVFDDNVKKFRAEVQSVLYGLTKQEIELPYYQCMVILDILTKEQGLQIGSAEVAEIWATVNNLNQNTELQKEQKRLVQLEFDKLDWQKQAKVLDYFFDYIKQNRIFAHDKDMLKLSQDWNAEQNKAHRSRSTLNEIISVIGYGASSIIGSAMVASGVGAAPGAVLASIGLTGMARRIANFGKTPQ